MPLTLHATRGTPHGDSRLVQAMSALWVKTRHAPSRHCRDTNVYGPTTMAMHGHEYTPPPDTPLANWSVDGLGFACQGVVL